MATTIRSLLCSLHGEDDTTVQPIVDALSALGFNPDSKAGDAFTLPNVDDVGLNVRQKCALKAAVAKGARLLL